MDNRTLPENLVFGLDIGTRSIVGTVGYKQTADSFVVAAQCVRFHETRAMMDGQIHDIQKVADTIAQVRRELEKQIDRKLSRVCIAAAGRVLKTVTVRVDENYGDENFSEELISKETIHSLEMLGIEKAYEIIRQETKDENINFYCVGYTVVHYYLNDSMMMNLEGHRGQKISAEVLATFLPEEVIDGLYSAVEKAGLEVDNLTLEPIAAINVAIPEKFRLLNIALVDVGAGTSDICITKEGTITAYGMIPAAGDAITDVIVQKHLVDFKTAEKMKLDASGKKKTIAYKDIMGLSSKTTPADLLEETRSTVEEITGRIAERIIELNGGKSVSAVFVVGGGGKLPTFTKLLAEHLKLSEERVALRGAEVLSAVTFLQDIKKDPLLVTPIGICLNYYEQKNSFIFVQVNGERIKLYDNSRLSVVDAALTIGFPNESLFPKRGTPLTYTLNGTKRMVRGEAGEAAVIKLNGKSAGINTPIEANDVIEIIESTTGLPAMLTVGALPEYHRTIEFIVNGKNVVCPKFLRVGNELVSEFYEIQEGDELEQLDYYTLEQLVHFMDLPYKEGIRVNHAMAEPDTRVYEKFTVEYPYGEAAVTSEPEEEEVPEEFSDKEAVPEAPKPAEAPVVMPIVIMVNGTPVTLKGKASYRVVDILDVYAFDVSTAHGSRVVIRVNGQDADFTTMLTAGNQVDLYWEK
ncbi:MAG: cell division protein FtsA [Lachnospiraceae bacterium]|nr:cell division protein FtsA [Lachnospiraceae bacterium]